MQSSMYSFSVPVFVKTLGNLSAILAKGAAYAEQKKFDPAVLLSMRLAPDMFPLTMQVRIACDFAKGATARLAGEEPPKWEDNETTIAELQDRIARTIAFIEGFEPARFDGAESRKVTLTIRGEPVEYVGLPYLAHVVLPNFFFHATTAYDILRHAGVELGKRDFIGKV
jgi:uncharacterized protein